MTERVRTLDAVIPTERSAKPNEVRNLSTANDFSLRSK